MGIGTGMLLCVAAGTAGAADMQDPAIAAVMAREAEVAAAHGRGDLAAYRAGLSRHYVYVDVGGKRVTADMLEARRGADQRRVVSSETGEEEALRVSEDVVLLRGLDHSLASYYGGLPRASTTRWTSVWVREEDGVWRVVSETATPVRENDALPFVHVPQSADTVSALAGRWRLATTPTLELQLDAKDGALVGRLAGQSVAWTFRPASASHWFAAERPFELRFAADGTSLQLLTWGTSTAGERLPD
ncbi:MAG: nuclear transport factor 2 family protein [Proteobacteria bacterium]|nr:nuclear transport factor 2 family protein [Pseudomonadota bacterium]